ncbi:DUF3304 domain-containing protein [Chromobacterium violaceum]|uniref:DUF3304 domain-containing protein n=1 Tax=Chromobacterium violaceum TaxID=536 RepID=UPI003DA8BDB6
MKVYGQNPSLKNKQYTTQSTNKNNAEAKMRFLFSLFFIVALMGCSNETASIPARAYNYTNHDINMVWVDGKWIGGPRVNESGGIANSVTLPIKYKPDTKFKVEWERSTCVHGTSDCGKRDASGQIIQEHMSKVITTPPYQEEDMAEMQVLLLPNDEVRIYVGNLGITHPKHPSHQEFGTLLDAGLRPLDGIWPNVGKNDAKGHSK